MFDLDVSKIALIGAVALIVIGPEKLPHYSMDTEAAAEILRLVGGIEPHHPTKSAIKRSTTQKL